MTTITVTYTLPEDNADMQLAYHAASNQIALDRIADEVFRPHRKHGYPDTKLQSLIDANKNSLDIIGMLEDLFFQIRAESREV